MPKLKLDLMNNRIEVPNSNRVYDSLEDINLDHVEKSLHQSKTLVKIAPNIIEKRVNQRVQISKILPVRKEVTKIDRRGKLIEIQDRYPIKDNFFLTNSSLTITTSSLNTNGDDPLNSTAKSVLSRDGLIHTVFETGTIESINTPKKSYSVDSESDSDEDDTITQEEKQKLKRRKRYKKIQEEREKQKEKEKEENYHPTLDKLRDKLYEDTTYTVEERLKSRKLPGATWSTKNDRNKKRPSSPEENPNVGPGYYEVYESLSSAKSINFEHIPGRDKKENIFATSDRILNNIEKINFKKDLEYFPLKEKSRIQRQIGEMKKKYPELIELKTKKFKNYIPPADYPALLPHSPKMTSLISNTNRFDDKFRKPEPYVKTTGLTLGPDYDKHLDKKITFQFSRDASKTDNVLNEGSTLSSGVDVHVEKYYAMEHLVMQSPLSYAASFKSSAKVGMEIPNPTTAPHIGPGAFNPYRPSIEVKEPHKKSLAFLSYKAPLPRPYSPDTFLPPQEFIKMNTKGPFFSEVVKESTGDSRNKHLETIVKEKMTKIYPRLATKKWTAQELQDIECAEPLLQTGILSRGNTGLTRAFTGLGRSNTGLSGSGSLSPVLGRSKSSLRLQHQPSKAKIK